MANGNIIYDYNSRFINYTDVMQIDQEILHDENLINMKIYRSIFRNGIININREFKLSDSLKR